MNYDPNRARSFDVADLVEVTLGCWEYRLTTTVSVRGNCQGFTNLEAAVGQLYEKPEVVQERNTRNEGGFAVLYVVLTNDKGDMLEIEDEDDRQEEWLKDLVVGLRIVGQEELK